MWLMLQQKEPTDFVIGTGVMHSVRDLVKIAFRHADLDWEQHVEIDESLIRPAEVESLCADASKAQRVLEWLPKMSFSELVAMMVDADIERLS